MRNFIATLLLLAIAVLLVGIFPGGREFLGNIIDSVTEKRDNVVEEYERVKGEVEDIKNTVSETKKKVEETVDTANKAVKTVSDTLDKVNERLSNDEKDALAEGAGSDEDEVTENIEKE